MLASWGWRRSRADGAIRDLYRGHCFPEVALMTNSTCDRYVSVKAIRTVIVETVTYVSTTEREREREREKS